MTEIGSFIELELRSGKEYYTGETVRRLNTCRAALWHAARCRDVRKVWLPKYECDTVREFLKGKGMDVLFYDIDENFLPQLDGNAADTAIVIPNYYGIFGKKHFESVLPKYRNVIVDNAQAFFAAPLDGCMNCYSARKFNGVPDGAYVIGEGAGRFSYEQDVSSDTAGFLLLRHEYGCKGRAYEARKLNEKRIDSADCLEMSELTRRLLDSLDYEANIAKRKENFAYARELFDGMNEFDINHLTDEDAVPMVYPLLVRNDGIIPAFHDNGIYQGHWWEYLVDEMPEDSFEYLLSRYIVPITIDQRVGKTEIDRQWEIVKSCFA